MHDQDKGATLELIDVNCMDEEERYEQADVSLKGVLT